MSNEQVKRNIWLQTSYKLDLKSRVTGSIIDFLLLCVKNKDSLSTFLWLFGNISTSGAPSVPQFLSTPHKLNLKSRVTYWLLAALCKNADSLSTFLWLFGGTSRTGAPSVPQFLSTPRNLDFKSRVTESSIVFLLLCVSTGIRCRWNNKRYSSSGSSTSSSSNAAEHTKTATYVRGAIKVY